MTSLSGYQIDQEGNQVIYPDISAEFFSIGKMFQQLEIERIAARGRIQEWHLLRRVAIEMGMIYHANPAQEDGFAFKNRNRFFELQKQCSGAAQKIGAQLKEFAPGLYKKHKAEPEAL